MLKGKRYFANILIICLFLALTAMAFEVGDFNSALEEAQSTPIDPFQSAGAGTNQIVEDPTLTGHVRTPVPEGVQLVTPVGTVSGITGSYSLLLIAGHLIGGVIISSADDNTIPTINPLTGDVIIYSMDQGDKVIVDYTPGPAYRAKMSEGVLAEIQTPQRIRFTAYGDDSYLKIKPTEEPSYDFNNGLFEYENDRIIEKISTTRENNAGVDPDYELGFKCFSLAFNATYHYIDKKDYSNSFSLRNLNNQDYQACIKKTAYNDYRMTRQLYCVIDLVKDEAKFRARFEYSKVNKVVLESLDERNDIVVEAGFGDRKITISNPAPSSEVISRVYSGEHLLTEKLVGSEVTRYHSFTKSQHPDFVKYYSTNFRNKQPDIVFTDGMVMQRGKNNFAGLTARSASWLNKILLLFQYQEPLNFFKEFWQAPENSTNKKG